MIREWVLDEDGMVRPATAYALIGLAVLVLGWVAYRAWQHGEGPTQGTWICFECGRLAKVTPRLDMHVPEKCPRCGKQSLVPANPCPKCKAPVALNEYRGLKPPTKCPKCGAEVRHGS